MDIVSTGWQNPFKPDSKTTSTDLVIEKMSCLTYPVFVFCYIKARGSMSDPLTQTVYDFLRSYFDQHGFAPSLREIARACFIGRSTTLRHLDRLEAWGWITREEGRARGIRLNPRPPNSPDQPNGTNGRPFAHP